MISSALVPWIVFNAGVLGLLALDRLVFQRRAGAVSTRSALVATAAWVAVSLGCGLAIWAWKGHQAGLQFYTGYLVEYSLSADNIFVFVLVFEYFRVAREFQPRVLSWGVLGAMVLRGVMIGAGALLIGRFHAVLYLFGVFLLVTGARMLFQREGHADIAANPVLRLARAVLPLAQGEHGPRFFVREAGRLRLTPLGLVLVVVECVDLVFAVDSVPAVFAITQDAFVVYTSNICAILGLRSLYFLLADAVPHLRYLKPALAVILCFIGAKMLLAWWYEIPNGWALGFVAVVLVVAVVASQRKPRPRTLSS